MSPKPPLAPGNPRDAGQGRNTAMSANACKDACSAGGPAPLLPATTTALEDWSSYLLDAWQRSVLFLDVLRQRGNEQEAIAASPRATVLHFEHEVLMSGRSGPLSLSQIKIANQIRAYWWCSPPRIGRQRMRPTVSAARDIGASLCNDKWVRVPL